MKKMHKQLLAVVAGIALASPLMAAEDGHTGHASQSGCDDKGVVAVDEMGIVNEALLQQHIDKVKAQMERIHTLSGPRVAQHRREMRQHLAEMQSAMQQLHNLMYAGGCDATQHGASLDVRVQVVEKRLDMMQQMMEQMIEHAAEQEKPG
jgi:hypothetical protein